MKKVIQKQVQKKLPPAKAKVEVVNKVVNKVPSGRIIMTHTDIKNMLIENQELKKQIAVLEKTLMSAGIEVDEKFGDNEDHFVVPNKDEVKGYTDLDAPKKTKSEIMENQSEMDDESDEYDFEQE